MRADEFLASVGDEEILPDPEGLLTAISSIGYRLEDAIADLVDNSIDANAQMVRIRILRDHSVLKGVVIADDGSGMTETLLRDAMAFGRRTSAGKSRLGKYGLGLKSASFSQCSKLTVLSRPRSGGAAGRVWTVEGVSEGWRSNRIGSNDATTYLDLEWLDGEPTRTIIRWDDLHAFRIPAARTSAMVGELFDQLDLHLGLHLHRFLERNLEITLDTLDTATGKTSAPRFVAPLNPFDYPASGHRDYPRIFVAEITSVGRLSVEAHIWPQGVRPRNLLLGAGQLAHRQGFYFYRNDRLIQGGGWNGMRTDAEPHLSLARARIELDPKDDSAFGLNVRKAGVNVPEGFSEALGAARSEGKTFRDYVAAAQRVYRKKNRGPDRVANFVLGKGVPARIRTESRRSLNGGPSTPVDFQWRKLPEGVFFELDRRDYRIILNARYRESVLHGRRGSGTDAVLVKLLLFLRLKDDLGKERIWEARGRQLEELQRLLVTAAEEERT
jgi:hypothetical protein